MIARTRLEAPQPPKRMTSRSALTDGPTTASASSSMWLAPEDFQVAMATYHAARKRWPKAAMTLRQGTWVIEDSRRTRIGTLFSFPWSEKGREGGGR
jgi:hypothetical protein